MFCFKCGTRVADDAVFCLNCGNRIASEQPVAQQSVGQEEVMQQSIIEQEEVIQPTYEQPINEQQAVVQQPVYDQSQYVQHGAFQPAQNMYQSGYNQPSTQAFYNTPAQSVKKEKASVPAVIFLNIAALAAIAISVGYFINGNIGLGVINAIYFVTSIMLFCYCFSAKKSVNLIKGAAYVLLLVMNVIFLGFSEIKEAFTIFGSEHSIMTDYYYAVILILQYIFLYVYLIASIIKSFADNNKTSYFTCLCGYFALIFIIAGAVVNIASDTPGSFIFSFIPIDLGIASLIAGDLFATLRKGKNAAEVENN